ncbi:peptide/nickel transport system substrate-binding protein [Parafrankia irregularis]|uniref:non-specific serine/threonine protein kinase n=1 Tax=Parafrankia irregularis TaxID=795642 RepID=A0A0S4QNJ1_9ACTN|nr:MULTISPECIES: ABC transporter substrate-binding protein [Parafrankia]MBE3206105.1 protein kinase [Parafrankia sp. CH37]CUU57011.1 peptide/nickel transport system substrate-binding protein [Parafrankia irregularis]
MRPPRRESVERALPGYEIGGPLGQGGFGVVLSGRHRQLGRSVAIKILDVDGGTDSDADVEVRRRFAAEARVLARLDHPHVVAIYDYLEHDDLRIIVMEQLTGGSLSQRLRATSPRQACAVGLCVAEALGAAHQVGVLHRDIKPANILFTGSSLVKVADFGIAKIVTESTSVTSGLVGTLPYMAPEQFGEGGLGPATDLYALGVTLYELFERHRPSGPVTTPGALVHWHLAGRPAPLVEAPAPVAGVVLRALAKDPAQRHPSARAFALDLAAAAAQTFGPGWLADCGIPVRLDDEVVDAARAAPPPALPPTAFPPTAAQWPASPPPAQPPPAQPPLTASTAPTPPPPPGVPAWTPPVPPAGAVPGSRGSGIAIGPPYRGSRGLGRLDRRRAVALATAVIVVVGTGLGLLFSWPDDSSGRRLAGDEAATATAAPSPWQPSGKSGGTLKLVASGGDCDSWDPGLTYLAPCWSMQRLVSRTLLTYRAEAGTAGTELVPDLAAAMPERVDGVTWKVRIRAGLMFQDGSVIRAADVKYAIARGYDQALVIRGAPGYFSEVLRQLPAEFAGPRDEPLAEFTSIDTPDETTLVFHLREPFDDFPYLLTLPQTAPIPARADVVTSEAGSGYDATRLVSSGPYQVESYTAAKSISFVRNPRWVAATDPNRAALPDQITVAFDVPTDEIDADLISGAYDADISGGSVGASTAAAIAAHPDLKARSEVTVLPYLNYLAVVTTQRPFDNEHCRRAVAWAVDRARQSSLRGYDAFGGTGAAGLLPPALAGYTGSSAFPSDGLRGDLDRARDELTACGHPDGFATTLSVPDRAADVKAAESIQDDLGKIGIKVTLKTYATGDFYDTLGAPDRVRASGIGLALTNWGPDWPSGYAFFHQIVDGRQIRQQGNFNISELDDRAVNDALDVAAARSDPEHPEAAADSWARVDQLVQQTAALVPLVHRRAQVLFSERLTNVYLNLGFNASYDVANLGVRPG